MIGRLRVGLLRGEGKLSEAEKKGLRSFSSIPTGLCASGCDMKTAGVDREVDGRIKGKGETEAEDRKKGVEEHIRTQNRAERWRLVSILVSLLLQSAAQK